MNIQQVDINSLIPYEFNNKIHSEEQINHIANSINEFGFLQPLVVDKNNVIVAWHGRREASRKLWMVEVPVILADTLTEVQIKKYRLLDNKLSDIAEWDLESVKIELEELGDIELSELFDEISIGDDIEDHAYDDHSQAQDNYNFDNREIKEIKLTYTNEQFLAFIEAIEDLQQVHEIDNMSDLIYKIIVNEDI